MTRKLKPLPSDEAYAAFRADEQAAKRSARFNSGKVFRAKYPGRNRVMAKEDALDHAYRAHVRERDNLIERYPCSQPYMIQAVGLPSATRYLATRWSDQPLSTSRVQLELQSRCRKCDNCLLHRRRLWAARAVDEVAASNRTWFGTLTVNPVERFLISNRAAIAAMRAGHGNWHAMDRTNQFRYLVKEASPVITKYLKRVRKIAGVPLRYLLVSEAHEDGFPHFHMLVHEPGGPVRKAVLDAQWLLGFSRWKLVEQGNDKGAYYVCKYLSKSNLTRVRASLRYGTTQLVAASTERMLNATRLIGGEKNPLPLKQAKKAEY